MSYKNTLDLISQEIASLSSDDSIKNLRVYKNNIFNLLVGQLQESYPSVYKYLGDRNFTYFCRKMFLDEKIKDPNINVFYKAFSQFLEKNKGIHNDEIVIGLSEIDKLWSYNADKKITVFEGTFEYWSALISNKQIDANIDLTLKEVVFSYEMNGERYLSVKLNKA